MKLGPVGHCPLSAMTPGVFKGGWRGSSEALSAWWWRSLLTTGAFSLPLITLWYASLKADCILKKCLNFVLWSFSSCIIFGLPLKGYNVKCVSAQPWVDYTRNTSNFCFQHFSCVQIKATLKLAICNDSVPQRCLIGFDGSWSPKQLRLSCKNLGL